MITELSAQNFKSWEDTGKLQLAPLTGFFGANSSGKSSILQVLLMLKQTVEHPPEWDESLDFGDEESLVDLRSFGDVIHRPVDGPSLGISVSWKLLEKIVIMDGDRLDALSFYFNLYRQSVGVLNYQVGKDRLGIEPQRGSYLLKSSDSLLLNPPGASPRPYRCYGIRMSPFNTPERFSDLEKAFENLFARIHYLGPRREDPRRYYRWEESRIKDVGTYGEKTVSVLLSSLVQQGPTSKQVMEWLQNLKLIYSYRFNPISDKEQDYEILVQHYKNGPEVGLTDVGFGVSQVLPLLTQCYYVDEGSILILEQPEAHLHPKAQSELADVLIDVVKNRNIQIILESHSEHLLHRLQRRIAEEKIAAEDTALYFCEINEGTSEIERLDVDEYGNILNYPPDFFGDDMGDLVAKTEAEMKRREVME